MKKDIEWLKEEIEEDIKSWGGGNPDYFRGASDAYENVKDWLSQLDEPEVLSPEWINEHAEHYEYIGYAGVPVDDLQNLLVPEQEFPVVPTWFDEWWEDVTKGGGNLFHNIERFYDELFSSGTRETYNYISSPDNKKKLLNIIVNELEYGVEEEQKYQVIIRDGEYMWLYLCKHDGNVTIGTNNNYIEKCPKVTYLTEQEIKDYDKRYWPFATKVKEMEE